MDIYGFLLCSFLFLCIHFFLTKRKFNRKRLPPGPTGLPVLGSLLTIGNRPYESLSKLSKTYGPLMTVKFGMINVVIASSSDMAKEILQKNDQAFIGRPTPESVAAGKFYDMSMVWSSAHSLHWKKLRKICNSQLFTTQRLDSLQDLRILMMKKMIARLDEACEAKEQLHVGRLVFGTTLNFLSNTMFSGDLFDMKSDAMVELKELMGELMEFAVKPNVADFLPFLRPFDPQGIRRGITGLYDRVHRFLDAIIDQRIRHRASNDPSERFGDFLDVLLDQTEEHELSYTNIMILFMDLFVAGTHTTTATMEWVMAELLHNPPVLAKAKQELSKNIPPRAVVQEQNLPHLPFLDAVIKETLRLHPAAPLLLPHLTEQEVEIHGYTIPKHTQVFVNVWSILRDPDNWDDPTHFKPERFLNSEIDIRGRDCKFIPFGAGRRICPGSNLAIRMVNLMLANLVHNFEWKLPNGLKPEDVDMRGGFGIALQKYKPLVAIPLMVKAD
ncbi:Cytochrome P450 CYP2 subfamily [Handroanthus impetiginosus]|uniref:Cytochrome P450 CYP2 subfamily n=1 Tax=Handroanthus impetiginosus TaxID=429701 RepID=A0A2G9HLA0_9LAMI|nr:Cytochrome P450 CYP2 subfamily [Handroanthus impetiginosus]